MKDTLTYILKAIVDSPEKVEVTEEESGDSIDFVIKVDKEDAGRVIGKGGKVIRAIRNVIKIMAIKEGKRINVSLAESI